jgi:hypothetical protein
MRDDITLLTAPFTAARVPFGYRSSTYFSGRRG